MFERYLTDALTKHFGHLVENLDAEKVRLSAWNGKLVLEDVYLRTDALDSFVDQCPVELAYGKVGKLDVQVPWSLVGAQLLRRRPTKQTKNKVGGENSATPATSDDSTSKNSGPGSVSVILSDVNILITPRRKFDAERTEPSSDNEPAENGVSSELPDNLDHNENDELNKKRKRKEKAVQELLDKQLLSRVARSSRISSSKWQWVQERLSDVLSSLSIVARNIHIRYEDPGHSMGFLWSSSDPNCRVRRYRKSFSIGITLREFSVGSMQQHDATPPGSREKDDCVPAQQSLIGNSIDDSASTEDNILDRPESPRDTKGQTKAYQIRRKLAAATELAVYWDSGGCILISEQAPFIVDGRHEKSNTKGKKLLEREYAGAAFNILNGDLHEQRFQDEELYNTPREYLLDPVSPRVHFAFATEEASIPGTTTDTNNVAIVGISPTTTNIMPASTVQIILPPTLSFISRQTLEDAVYLRKSLDVWAHGSKGILPEQALKRLANLRPSKPATKNPRGWWMYAVEATIAFIKVEREQDSVQAGSVINEEDVYRQLHRSNQPRGWVRLARALGKRRRYISLYRELFSGVNDEKDEFTHGPILPLEEKRNITHKSLLELEDELTSSEICAFRVAASEIVTSGTCTDLAREGQDSSRLSWQDIKEIVAATNSSKANPSHSSGLLLTLDHRCSMFLEMGQALEQEQLNEEIRQMEEWRNVEVAQRVPNSPCLENELDRPVWEISVSCKEMSLQVHDNDQPTKPSQQLSPQRVSRKPIVRLSCAFVVDCHLRETGSWEVGCTFASLLVEDLTGRNSQQDYPALDGSKMRTLVGPKRARNHTLQQPNEDHFLMIGGESFQQCMRLNVRRKLHSRPAENDDKGGQHEFGSTTWTEICLYPMEIIYSTIPVEGLSRVLAAVKTPELSDDYHRMASRVYEWRERQKKRLLEALAHEGKRILVDVDVAAPVLLVPETSDGSDSPMLVLDLGHLRFSNDMKAKETDSRQFADAWQLSLTSIQMQCTSTMLYYGEFPHNADITELSGATGNRQSQQVVDPFSIDFSILTYFAEEGDESRIKVAATLPSLSFNVTSSAARLLIRLRDQWSQRKYEIKTAEYSNTITAATLPESSIDQNVSLGRDHSNGDAEKSASTTYSGSKGAKQSYEFEFFAPLVTIRVSNDVDGRMLPIDETTLRQGQPSTPLVSLAIHGIGACLSKKIESSGSVSTNCAARLHSLVAVDHFCSAGKEYSLILSSLDPAIVLSKVEVQSERDWREQLIGALALPGAGKDLVLVNFSSSDGTESKTDSLSIEFHELFLAWNPETFAAMQKALRSPRDVGIEVAPTVLSSEGDHPEIESNGEFFDAQEDVFFDALPDDPASDDMSPLRKLNRRSTIELLSLHKPRGRSSLGNAILASASFETDKSQSKSAALPKNDFEIVFNLSKLQVNLNKEARHRRLLTAEMDRTYVQCVSKASGESKTVARLGNLIFHDPASDDCKTVYGQILGLQTGVSSQAHGSLSSLLEMEIVSRPKTRRSVNLDTIRDQPPESGVSICYEDGSVSGFDTQVKAHFSPMRFVYLQQLWSEIVDYFFEGIMGYEVLGKTRPATSSETSDAGNSRTYSQHELESQTSFTKFHISLDSPVVLFPVTYRSPHFFKVHFAHIRATNYFDVKRVGQGGSCYNNCNLHFQSMKIYSWDSQELSHSKDDVGAEIDVRWPIGPLAKYEIPKYHVSCRFLESLNFCFRRDDYALVQNVITSNVGEESRNLHEWMALQNLPAGALQSYKDGILVHFGYDSKDVAPSTYQISLSMPTLTVTFQSNNGSPIAVAQCRDLRWNMKKGSDRISHQTVTCDINLVHHRTDKDVETLLSFNKSSRLQGELAPPPELKYTSTSKPSGDNVKSLEIVDSCFFMVYPGWKRLMEFFRSLPEAEMMTPEQINLAIQVGDRWYKIGSSSRPEYEDKDVTTSSATSCRLSWISPFVYGDPLSKLDAVEPVSPNFQMRVLLSSPCIILSSADDADPASVVLRLDHLDFLHDKNGKVGNTTKSFFLDGLELYTSLHDNGTRHSSTGENSLIHPWCVSGAAETGVRHDCDQSSFRISADVLRARAAFSDMMVAIQVCLRFVADFRQCRIQDNVSTPTPTDTALEAASEAREETEAIAPSTTPTKSAMTLDWGGFHLLVVDDSGRHFAGSQELITLVLGRMLFSRQDCTLGPGQAFGNCAEKSDYGSFSQQMTLNLQSVDLLDCLQPELSPFRLLLTSRCDGSTRNDGATASNGRMSWSSHAMQESDKWGFVASPALLESMNGYYNDPPDDCNAITFTSFDDGGRTRSYATKVPSCSIQYNPSTVIALQRSVLDSPGRVNRGSGETLPVP